jgi:DNA-binding winged helix-turn-helix (wHTH) protein
MTLPSKANLAVVPQRRIGDGTAMRPSRVRFGEFEFDCKAGELRRGEEKIVLQSQPHKILLMLVGRPGEFVTRDEIQQRLWTDDVIVNFDVSINQAMSKLRHALNDPANNPRYIETIGRRGYRLLARVEPVEGARQAGSSTADAPLLQVIAGAAGHQAEEMEAIAESLLKLLPLLVCLNRTGEVSSESATSPVPRRSRAM